MKRFFPILILVVLILLGVLALNFVLFIKTPSGETGQSLRIERGALLGTILRDLEERGVVSNGTLFRAYLLWKKASGKIRAGEYTFPPRIKPEEVLALLMKGDFATRRVTIPEGSTLREIANNLGSLGLVHPEIFRQKCSDPNLIRSLGLEVQTLEGYLFPDTYEIYRPKDEEEVIRRLVGHFREIFAREFESRSRERNLTVHEVLTIASIIEKETAAPVERPLIASVLLNRLKKEMPLATDPAVIYGLANFSGNLTRSDLDRPGPYNTYLNPGLPPTPISNPGRDAIRAVLYPAETDYLFFVSRNDGTHQFSATAEEHAAAVRRYQSVRSSRQRAETRPTVPTPPPESMNKMPETSSAKP